VTNRIASSQRTIERLGFIALIYRQVADQSIQPYPLSARAVLTCHDALSPTPARARSANATTNNRPNRRQQLLDKI
jgi:hypothetical protein